MEVDSKKLWSEILKDIKSDLSPANFRTWFSATKLENNYDNEKIMFKVVVLNNFVREQIQARYLDQIKDRISQKYSEEEFDLTVEVGKVEILNIEDQPKINEVFKEQTSTNEIKVGWSSANNLNPNFTFDKFVVGNSNNLAFAAAQAVAQSPGSVYNPFFIYGGVGVGKTHLMQAVANGILERDSSVRVIYTTCEKFTNEFIESISSKNSKNFREKFRRNDILMIDDIQFLSGKESTQEEFFHTFNELYGGGKQIIMTSDRHPSSLGKIEDRLVSRFLGGLTVDIGNPDFEMRVAIINQKIKTKNLDLTPEIVDIIASKVDKNTRELEGVLTGIISLASLRGQAIDVDIVKKFFGIQSETRRSKPITPRRVISVVGNKTKISTGDILGKNRQKELVTARQIVMYLLREEYKFSLVSIGDSLGGRDHTTVMHGVEKIKTDIKTNINLRELVLEINNSL
ncbi:chromosomal replication initiator protein DnaA [Candidatus Curtissbacteria bacterium]|nr:chromosomal replication initiator protein DnaA [Candidatus Curtissbacteria bacterium]